MKVILFALLSFSMLSCTLDDEATHVVDPTLKPYTQVFAKEAIARGYKIDIRALSITFKLLPGKNGEAYENEQIIFIDSTSSGYKINPEALVFHEMAHVYLHSVHNDGIILMKANNALFSVELPMPQSIMHSSMVPDYMGNRKYYVDELFNLEYKKS